MSSTTNSGIRTSNDGSSYIPASRRADGTTRKEIRVRPGWTPQEDVKTYKSRNAEAWRDRGSSGVPGTEGTENTTEASDTKSKNAKRREAAKKKQAANDNTIDSSVELDTSLAESMDKAKISAGKNTAQDSRDLPQLTPSTNNGEDAEVEKQKKIRNQLKKLKAVKELKSKKMAGEKLSHDQLMKMSKEEELLRDLKKLGYNGPEVMDAVQETSVETKNHG